MTQNKIIAILIFVNLNILLVTSEESYFAVPLELDESNRPHRLVDDNTDPDMIHLKNIQDQFFTIVKNSSIGQEFKSFNQLLNLLDSEAGLELGRLLMNGFMIGFGKEKSSEIFLEFLDDFQYKVSPTFGKALKNYKDFLKTVDLQLIPLTIQTLFQKDELGNSLAQMPMGQLVDLVQPEASKYGIDIKAFINGIIGKGDKTFPDLFQKLLDNFNFTSMMRGFSNINIELDKENIVNKNEVKNLAERKKSKKDPTILLFKPFIAKFLKENEIDLEVDAVIQVMTPFIEGAGELFENMFKSNGIDNFNLAQLAPILGFLAASGQKRSSGKNEPDFLNVAMSLLGGTGDNKDMDIGNILNMISMFTGGISKSKNAKTKKGFDKNQGPLDNVAQSLGMDTSDMLQIASSLMSSASKGKYENDIDSNLDPTKLLELASNFLGSMNSYSEQNIKDKKSKLFLDMLGPYILRIQRDKKWHSKIKPAISLVKNTLFNEEKLNTLKSMLPLMLESQLQAIGSNVNVDLKFLSGLWSLNNDDFSQLMNKLDEFKDFNALNEQFVAPLVEIIELMATEKFQKKLNEGSKAQISLALNSIGLNGQDVTILNFASRLKPLTEMASKSWDLPVSLSALIDPLKTTLVETSIWYLDAIEQIKHMSRKEIESMVKNSLVDDFIDVILEINNIAKNSKSSLACLPREVCELVNDVYLSSPDTLKFTTTRIFSIIYGGFRTYNEDNLSIFLEVVQAASIGEKCDKLFPIQCPESVPSSQDEESTTQDAHQHMHDDL